MVEQYSDMVYGSVDLSPIQSELKATPEMFRSQNVTQLGLTPRVFWNAMGNRFMHNMGVSILAGKFAQALRLSEGERNLLEAAGALHDLGHMPFSHAAEEFYESEGLVQESESVRRIRESEKIPKILNNYGVPIERVCSTIDHPDNRDNPNYFHQLISGDMDTDRLDYLVRDSKVTVRLGTGIEISRLLQCAKIEDEVLFFEQGALPVITHFFATYQSMYLAVYHNRNTCAYEAMLNKSMQLKRDILMQNGSLAEISEIDLMNILLQEGNDTTEANIAANLANSIFVTSRPYKDIFAIPSSERNPLERLKAVSDYLETQGTSFEKDLLDKFGLPEGSLLVIFNDFLHKDDNVKTDVRIQPFTVGGSTGDLVKLEDICPKLDYTPRPCLHYLAFRVIGPEDHMNLHEDIETYFRNIIN